MTEIKYLPKLNGSILTNYEIVCSDEITATEVYDGVKQITSYGARQNGLSISGQTNKRDMQRIEAMIRRIQQREQNVQEQIEDAIEGREPTQETRVVVPYRKYQVGDVLRGKTIVRLGQHWAAKDDDYSVYNIEPWVDYIQYAYLQ